MAKRWEYRFAGTQPIYDRQYERLVMLSSTLKGLSTSSCNLNDKAGLIVEKFRLVGSKEGKYWYGEGSRYQKAIIPEIEEELKDVERRFQNYRQKKVNEGYRPIPNDLDHYPDDLKEKRLKLEAEYDVRMMEVAWIDKALEKYDNQSEEIIRDNVLKYGCKQSSKLRDGIVAEIDGQKCSINSKGLVIIDDAQSPYDGMLVADYRSVVCEEFSAMQKAKDQAWLLRLQEQARIDGLPIPKQTPLMGGKTVSRESLPKWPSGVKDWKAEGKPNYDPKVKRRHVPKE